MGAVRFGRRFPDDQGPGTILDTLKRPAHDRPTHVRTMWRRSAPVPYPDGPMIARANDSLPLLWLVQHAEANSAGYGTVRAEHDFEQKTEHRSRAVTGESHDICGPADDYSIVVGLDPEIRR